MGVLTNYVTEKIKDLRYVSVDDDGVTKKKLFLQPTDSEERFEVDFSAGVDLEEITTALSGTYVQTTFDVKEQFGAEFDGKVYSNASIAAASTRLTLPTATLTNADEGKVIQVLGAGAAGANLVTTIADVVSATTLDLAVAATTAVVASRVVTDGATTLGSQTVTSATAAFTDSDVGKSIQIGSQIVAEIVGRSSATSITVLPAPKTTAAGVTMTITGGIVAYGTDDTAAWQACAAAVDAAGGGTVTVAAGCSIVNGEIDIHGGVNPGFPTGVNGVGFPTGKRGGVTIRGESNRASRVRQIAGATLFNLEDLTNNKEGINFVNVWLDGPGRKVPSSRAIYNHTGGEAQWDRLAITGFETGIQFYDTTLVRAEMLHVEWCGTGVKFGWQSDQMDFHAYVRGCGTGYLFGATDAVHTTRDLTENCLVIRSGDCSYNGLGFSIFDQNAHGITFDHTYFEGNVKTGEVSDAATNGGIITGVEWDGCWFDPQRVMTGPDIEVFTKAMLTFRNCNCPPAKYGTFLKGRNDIQANQMKLIWENNGITATTAAFSFSGRSYNPGYNTFRFGMYETHAFPADLGDLPAGTPVKETQGTGAANVIFHRWTRRISGTNAVSWQADVLDSNGVGRIQGVTGAFICATNVAALPTAGVDYRGALAFVAGNGTSTADTLYVCLLAAAGTYSWKSIVAG